MDDTTKEDGETLARTAQRVILSDGHLYGCPITVRANGRALHIVGNVSSYYKKSLAQTILMRFIRERKLVHEVDNRLVVG